MADNIEAKQKGRKIMGYLTNISTEVLASADDEEEKNESDFQRRSNPDQPAPEDNNQFMPTIVDIKDISKDCDIFKLQKLISDEFGIAGHA
jgi:hypothetical protein